MQNEKTRRNKQMLAMRKKGISWRKIGNAFKVHFTTARAIIKRRETIQ